MASYKVESVFLFNIEVYQNALSIHHNEGLSALDAFL
jgi:hypothetical protein